jgi:hypothetical protein
MSRRIFPIAYLTCIFLSLFLTIFNFPQPTLAIIPNLNEQDGLIHGWHQSLNKLRADHSYFFSKQSHNDVLIEFESFLTKMRGLGVDIDSPDGWNALGSLSGLKNGRHFGADPKSTGMTRGNRLSQFTPHLLEKKNQIHIPERAKFLTPRVDVSLSSPNTISAMESLLYPTQANISDSDGCFEGDLTCHQNAQKPQQAEADDDPSTTPEAPSTPPPTPQHLIPSVQGLESNRGSSTTPRKTESWCRSVLQDSYQVYPQRLVLDIEEITISFQDLECERHIERDDLVRVLPITAALISDDELRYEFAKLGCSWFYRPLSDPTRLPCVSQCTRIRNFVRDLDITNASPAQLKDRAVLQTVAWPILLLAGQCEYTAFYDTSDDPRKCTHPDDTNVFKPFGESTVGRPTCQPYPEHGSFCSGLLTNSFSDPTNTAIDDVITETTPLLHSLLSIAPSYNGSQCAKALAQQICSKYIKSCAEVPVTMMDSEGQVYAVKYALPVLSHYSICTNYAKECGSFIQTISSLQVEGDQEEFRRAISLLDPSCDSKSPISAVYECDGIHYSSTYDSFPKSTSYSMGLGVSIASIQTNNFTYATQQDQSKIIPFFPEISCPAPLVIPDMPDDPTNGRIGSTSCALPCPSILYTDNDYKHISTASIVFVTFSFFCALFLFGSYLFFKEIRRGNYFLQFLICLMMVCTAFAIGAYSRYTPGNAIQPQHCISNTQLSTQNDSPGCTVEAFVIVFALLSIAAFFASSGFDLFLRVVLLVEIRPHTQQDYLLNLGYYFWGLTLPLLLTTIATGTDSLGPSDDANFYCFVHGRANKTVPWATFYLPICVQIFIGSVSLGTTIYHLARNAKRHRDAELDRQARDYNYRVSTHQDFGLGAYIVPLLLELIFFLYLGWIITLRVVIHFTDNRTRRAITNYANCLLINQPLSKHFSTEIDCNGRPGNIPVGLWWFNQLFMASLGIFTFLVLGTQRVYYQLWAAVVGYYLNFPTLLVWAATTKQAKIYGRRLARQRRIKARKLRVQGEVVDKAHQKAVEEGKEIVEQIKEQDKLVKEKLRQEQEEKQKKEREKALQLHQQNLNMIAPHLRPLYMIQQRPRRVLPSLVDLAQNPEVIIGPAPVSIVDIYTVFNVHVDQSAYTQPATVITTRDEGYGLGLGSGRVYGEEFEYDD